MIQVRSPGMFSTVQDLGRFQYGPLGVSPSGAADPIALRLANLLVGNNENAAAIEMTFQGATLVFQRPAIVSVTGSECSITLDSDELPGWTAFLVGAGQTLKIGTMTSGARGYLAVRGGFVVESFLGSSSTHILSHLGGLDGRQLLRGDVLTFGELPHIELKRPRRLAPDIISLSAPRTVIRTTVAPQTAIFSPKAVETFYAAKYQVTGQSNRMGLRLSGPAITAPSSGDMISEGVSLGAIQIPAGGLPIILFVEQQTTGGYPKIANIITADLPGIGQLRPNDVVQFQLVSPEDALAAIHEQERLLQMVTLGLSRDFL